jgi:hypothetical protein
MDHLHKDSQMIMIHKFLKKKRKPWCIRSIFRGKKSKGLRMLKKSVAAQTVIRSEAMARSVDMTFLCN